VEIPARQDESSRRWLAWAASAGLEPHAEVAARAAIDLLRTGASVAAAIAAAHIAASRGDVTHRAQLQAELDWIRSVLEDLQRQQVPAWLVDRYRARHGAVWNAFQLATNLEAQAAAQRLAHEATELRRYNEEAKAHAEAQAQEQAARPLREHTEREALKQRVAATGQPEQSAPVAYAHPSAPAAPSRPPKPPPPPRPSLQEFLSEHSILIVSYTGAFLLFIATLLFELYTIKLNGGLRFAGVLGLDAIFALAGVACLRSRRLRLVGQTYVAIFALLAPLVFIAAYVFLDMHAKGISTDLAFLVAGAACCALYIVLTLRLRLHAYGVLALLALPVAWLGAVDLLELDRWRGPALSPLTLVYTLVLFESPKIRIAGDRFSRFALPFVHAAAALAVGFTAYSLAIVSDAWFPWVAASTLAGLALSYVTFRALGGPRYGSVLALAAVGLAALAAAHDSDLGVWRAAALSPLVAIYTVVQLRPSWFGPRARLFSDDARWFVHTAALVVLSGVLVELAQAFDWIRWAAVAALSGVAAGYVLNRLLGGKEIEAVAGQTAFGLAWVAVVHDAGLGAWGGVTVAPLLAVYAYAGSRSFSRFSAYFVHAAAIAAIVTLSAGTSSIVLWPAAATFAGLTAGYVMHRLLGGHEPSGTLSLVALGFAWFAAVEAVHLGSWNAVALAPLGAAYAFIASRRLSIIPRTAPYFIHVAFAGGVFLLVANMSERGLWLPYVVAVTAAAYLVAYLVDIAFNRRQESAIVALTLFGVAWISLTDALHLGWWRGAAISPLVALYAVVAFRGERVGEVGRSLSRNARWLAHTAAAAALLLAFGDMYAAGHWIAWTGSLTLVGITAGYLLFALLGVAVEGAVLAQLAFGIAWTLTSTDLHLGVWRGASLTLLVGLYGLIAYRGGRVGRAGSAFARYASPRIHGAAAVGLALTAYSVVSARAWLPWSVTAMFAGLALAYFFICLLGGPVETALISLAAFGLAWTGAAHDLGLAQWRSSAVALLPALYSLAAFRGARFGAAGSKFARHATLFIHGGGALALAILMLELAHAETWISWAAAATFAILAGSYLMACALGGGVEMAILFKVGLGLAWIAGAHDLVPGAWWPAAVAPLVALYAVIAFRGSRSGRLGEKLAQLAPEFVDVSALAVVVLTLLEIGLAHAWLPWAVTTAAIAVGAGYVLYCWLGGEWEGAVLGLAFLLVGWGGLAQDLHLGSWRGSAVAAAGFVLAWIAFRAHRLGRVGTLFSRWSDPYVHIAAGLGIAWVAFDPSSFIADRPMAAVLAITASVYGAYTWLSGRQPALLVTAVAVTGGALFESRALGLSSAYVATELTLLAVIGAGVAHVTNDRILTVGLRFWMVVQLLGVAGLNPTQHWVEAADLLLAAAVVAWVARDSRTPAWLLFAAGLFIVDWYRLAQTVLPRPAEVTFDTLVRIYSPLPVLLGLVGLGLRSAAGRRWAWPLYLYTACLALALFFGALSNGQFEQAGLALLAYSVILYATGAIEGYWPAAVSGGFTTAAGLGLLLYASAAAPEWYPAAGFATSAVLYALQVPWERRFARTSAWIQSHRVTGLGGAAVSSLSSFAFTSLVAAHSWGALAAAAGLLGFGVLVVIDGRRHGRPEFDYAGATLMSLAGLWIAFYFGATNLEWYVILPGAVVIASGVRLPYDQLVKLDRKRLIAQILTGAGMVLILGTSAVLTVLEPPSAWLYTSALVVESVAAVLAGIGFRNRVLLIGGNAGVAISALRAIFVGITQGWLPVWAVFFVVSMLLLGLGAALALLRDRLPEARLKFGDTWHNWN
jgi:hypothetical protein